MCLPSSPRTLLSLHFQESSCASRFGTHTSTSWLRDLASGQESAVPQRAATKQKNSMPTRSAHLPINLAYSNRESRSTGQVDCLPESNRGPGRFSTALLRKYSLRNSPGLWDQVLKTKVTLQRSFFSVVSESWPQAVFLDCCPSRDSAWEHLGEDSKEVFADCLSRPCPWLLSSEAANGDATNAERWDTVTDKGLRNFVRRQEVAVIRLWEKE